jgi:hypothetical protein
MSQSFFLLDPLAVADLQVYLSRAARVEDGSVRLIAGSGVLAAYTAILYPRGLLDHCPTVLGLRTFAIRPGDVFDVVVPSRSMLDRLARLRERLGAEGAAAGEDDGSEIANVEVRLPLEVSTVTWAGISPPRGGWMHVGSTGRALLESVAAQGIAEVAEAVPTGIGEQLVQRVRAEVWGKPIEGLEYVPAGAAFAASSLGFLGPGEDRNVDGNDAEAVELYETGPWTRLSSRRGHVLVRRQAWTLKP